MGLVWILLATLICLMSFPIGRADGAEPILIGHWPLRQDVEEVSGSKLKSVARNIRFAPDGPSSSPTGAAVFNGLNSVIEVAPSPALDFGATDFSVAMWVKTEDELDDLIGDLVSRYDSTSRTGFHLGIYTHGGVTTSQSNSRQLHFGIDSGRLDRDFLSHGRLGNAVFVFALCVYNDQLYAATCHAGKDEAGHIFRFAGSDGWIDLGSPDKANAISAMAVHKGRLFVASSKYRLAGSSLSESQNMNFGGKVYQLGENDQWIACGTLSPETEAVGSLVVFNGDLYASSLYRPAGFFRYAGGQQWEACPTPDGKRAEALAVFNGAIYATCYDEGSVFRFDGRQWEHVGKIPNATQTYGFGVYRGELYVSEWPQAHVFRYIGGSTWVDSGKLGEELEAMPLLVYNGKMYGGTLPRAEVYRFEGGKQWAKIGQVDKTPDVKYRRAWSMAVFKGRLYVGTLPAGQVLSTEAGRNATLDRELASGWHHLSAVRALHHLELYVDGELVAKSPIPDSEKYVHSTSEPLYIGFGAQDFFRGQMADVRLYRGSLTPEQARRLARQ